MGNLEYSILQSGSMQYKWQLWDLYIYDKLIVIIRLDLKLSLRLLIQQQFMIASASALTLSEDYPELEL